MPLSEHSISIILLAAGRGTRMGGGGTPKLLLPMPDGRPILRHAVEGALALEPTELIAVVRPDLQAIEAALAGLPLRCVTNPRYMEGVGTSLALGVQSLPPLIEAVLVMLGDEPAVPPFIVRAILDAYLRERKPITTPIYGDQPGPPTLFSRALFSELSKLEGDTGGRQLIARHRDLVCRVPFAEQDRPRDIDTPEEYRSIVRDK
jgi:molybdenum cofactor cytidylyltransferase